MSSNLQICYMPYLFLGKTKEIAFKQAEIWNFGLQSLERIASDELRRHVAKLLAANRMYGKPLDNIAIISFANKDLFSPLSKPEYDNIDELKKVLFLASVSHSNIHLGPNTGLFMVTSDNFSVIYQNFQLGSNDTAFLSGKLVEVGSGGHKLDEIICETPRFVLHKTFQIDQQLFSALVKVSRKTPSFFRLIVRATDAMMNGYSNSDDISYESRILEQSRAFEILLKLPEKKQRHTLKEYVLRDCIPDRERRVLFKSERSNGTFKLETGPKQVMWADRFYTLRNHITHGDKIKPKEFLFSGQPHCHLGLWFFLVLLKKEINRSVGAPLFYDVIRNESGKFEYDKNSLIPIIRREVEKLINDRKFERRAVNPR